MMASSARVCYWHNWEEWQHVYQLLFNFQDTKLQEYGVKLVKVWRSRACGKLPIAIDLTANLVDAHICDLYYRNVWSNEHLSSLMGMTLVRFVNGMVDMIQSGKYARSVQSVADDIGLPDWIVDVRHNATHSDLPSLQILRTGIHVALDWLQQNYWEETREVLCKEKVSPAEQNLKQTLVSHAKQDFFVLHKMAKKDEEKSDSVTKIEKIFDKVGVPSNIKMLIEVVLDADLIDRPLNAFEIPSEADEHPVDCKQCEKWRQNLVSLFRYFAHAEWSTLELILDRALTFVDFDLPSTKPSNCLNFASNLIQYILKCTAPANQRKLALWFMQRFLHHPLVSLRDVFDLCLAKLKLSKNLVNDLNCAIEVLTNASTSDCAAIDVSLRVPEIAAKLCSGLDDSASPGTRSSWSRACGALWSNVAVGAFLPEITWPADLCESDLDGTNFANDTVMEYSATEEEYCHMDEAHQSPQLNNVDCNQGRTSLDDMESMCDSVPFKDCAAENLVVERTKGKVVLF